MNSFQTTVLNWYKDARGPFFTRLLSIEEHLGTHVDAPAHFIPDAKYELPHTTPYGGVTVEQLELEQMMGPADVIDMTHLTDTGPNGESPIITVDDVQRWETRFGQIAAHDIVIFRTDWTDRHYKKGPAGSRMGYDPIITKTAPAWPAPSAETMTYLVDLGVHCVGIDNHSMGLLQADAETHWAGLGRGTVFVERLTNLGLLPPRGAFFLFLPLKVEAAGGGPGRAIAFVPKSTS
jgi:kynurenine formamidase